MFEISQKITCVDAEGRHALTVGKEYAVVSESTALVFVVDDRGDTNGFYHWRFEPVITVESPEIVRKVGDVLFSVPEVRITGASGASKSQKPVRYDLIPVEALAEVAYMYGCGVMKYSARNFEGGYDYSLSIAAIQRHLEKFKAGVDFDTDWSKEEFWQEELPLPHHLAAVVFHALALMQFQAKEVGTDDRANQ